MMMFDFAKDPFENFHSLLADSEKLGIKDPNAMTLSTVSKDGQPSSRTVLYKDFFDNSFVFYTNYNSQKSKEIEFNPKVSLLFFWRELERQIRIVGQASKIDRAKSEAYFASRPRESQLGAWASAQSEKIENYEALKANFDSFESKFHGEVIPCPPHWGGWAVKPLEIEFWFGRVGRMHERYIYSRSTPTTLWSKSIKSP